MDSTPKKLQIISNGGPLSKFEDSPVFNFINSLSPIKPVKSSHFTRPFDPLNFASPPSVFTSPHISSHKESGLLKRSHSYSEAVELGRNDASKLAPSEAPSPVPSVLQCEAEEVQLSAEPHLEGVCQIEKNKDISPGSDWESLISDTADLLIFSSTEAAEAFKGLIQKSLPLEPAAKFCTALVSPFQETSINDLSSGLPCHPDEQGSQLLLPNDEDDQPKEMDNIDYEAISNLHRGISRRCLDFETLGGQVKNSNDDSKTVSSVDKQLVKQKASSKCILPGIGLHLNAICSRNTKIIKQETLSSRETKSTSPNSSSCMRLLTTGHEDITEALTQESAEKETNLSENGLQLTEIASEPPAYVISEELSQGSPKRKRRKSDAGEGESCKRCNCKKSKCLKLYCECFAAGVYCIEPCSCQDCYNKPIHEDTVLATRKQIESRNPLAFAPKVIRSSDSIPEGDDSSKTPASARHKRGCNCKKSSCLKKYCECYQGGVGCSINCRCEGCKNAFGTKDGSIVEAENVTEEETDAFEERVSEKALPKAEMFNDEEQNLPPTLQEFYTRELVQPPFSSKNEFPRSLVAVGSSRGVFIGQGYAKLDVLKPGTKQFPYNDENKTLERFGADCSPTTTTSIKTSSPNSKRISLPELESTSIATPGRRSSRKLILQSIPSFPSLSSLH